VDVDVAVRVDDRRAQRLGQRRPLEVARVAGLLLRRALAELENHDDEVFGLLQAAE
jgi:hypothetical protein